MAQSWNKMAFKVLSNPNRSMNLCQLPSRRGRSLGCKVSLTPVTLVCGCRSLCHGKDQARLAARSAQLDGLCVCLQCEVTSGRMALAVCCAPALGQPSPDLLTLCLVFRAALASAHQCHPLPQTLSVLKSTPQVRGMHTIIR